jgi:predicted Zn finger-like uncharacterized protein
MAVASPTIRVGTTMLKVACTGCKSPYQIEERRIPPAGLKMRCPKCGVSLLVTLSGVSAVSPVSPVKDAPGKAPSALRLAAAMRATTEPDALDADLPAVAQSGPAAERALPQTRAQTSSKREHVNRETPPAMPSFGELDAIADLPASSRTNAADASMDFSDLPAVAAGSRGLAPAAKPKGDPRAPRAPIAKAPAVTREAPKAAPQPTDETDLPTVIERASDLPAAAPARGFGELDMLTPQEAEEADSERDALLPAPKRLPSFGQIDTDLGLDADLPEAVSRPRGAPASSRSHAGPASSPIDIPPERPSKPELVLREPDPEDEPYRRRSRPSFAPEISRDLPRERTSSPALQAPAADLKSAATALDHKSPIDLPRASERTSPIDLPRASERRQSPLALPTLTADPKGARDMPAVAPEKKGSPKAAATQKRSATQGARTSSPPGEAPDVTTGERISIELLLNETLRNSSPPEPPTGSLVDEIGLAGAAREIEPSGNIADRSPSNPDVAFSITKGSPERDSSLAGAPANLSSGAARMDGTGARRGPRGAPNEDAPRKRSGLRAAVLGSLLIIAGSSLTLLPDVGAFGWKAISDRVSASSHAAALADLRAKTHADLNIDTYASSAAALSRARSAQQAAPRHRPTAAYTAYVAMQRSLRFGRRGEDEASAKQLLKYASPEPSDALTLAIAAQDAVDGQLDRAKQSADALAQRLPGDIDAAVLLGEIELALKAHDRAVVAWKRAAEITKSARTLYGLARAELAAGDAVNAEASARAAIVASPEHAGARWLLASALWRGEKREEEAALTSLREVTAEGSVKSAASEAELVAAHTLLGTIHLARSRISAAEQAFAEALRLDPQAMDALLGSGELFYRSGRYTEASARWSAAMQADPKSAVAKIGAAKTWLALERMKEARDLLKKAQGEHAGEPLIAFWLGRVEEALGNKKDAEAAYLDAINVGEGKQAAVDAYVALSYMLGSLGRADEAATKLAEATTKYPDLPALSRAKGEIALQAGRYEDAKRELTTALSREDDLGTRFKLGVTLRRMRAFEQAAAVFDKVAEVDEDFPGLALERGLLFEETGQSERALEMYAAALEKAPTDLDLRLRVGSTQVIAGRARQAEMILREVVRQRPDSAEANHFLGRALLLKGSANAEAMRFLERAVEIDPNRAEYHLYVGWAANETSGQQAKAEAALKRALDIDRELADAYWQRGVLRQKQGAIVDALADLGTALAKRPSRFEAYATIALCFQDQGRWPEAEDAWRKALAGNDRIAEWHYRLGKIYAGRGNRVGAAAELEKAVLLGEAPEKPRPAWMFDAHFLLAEAMRASGNTDRAIEHYKRYLASAPPDNAYRPDAERALQSLGVVTPPP